MPPHYPNIANDDRPGDRWYSEVGWWLFSVLIVGPLLFGGLPLGIWFGGKALFGAETWTSVLVWTLGGGALLVCGGFAVFAVVSFVYGGIKRMTNAVQSRRPGWVNIHPAANHAGESLTPAITGVLRRISHEFGEPITVTRGTNHPGHTTVGNVSDHASGNGADLYATGSKLVRLGQAALIVGGMLPEEARLIEGGSFEFRRGERRLQVGFNTDVGGCRERLHVGVA